VIEHEVFGVCEVEKEEGDGGKEIVSIGIRIGGDKHLWVRLDRFKVVS
jgi:hypothetical protein